MIFYFLLALTSIVDFDDGVEGNERILELHVRTFELINLWLKEAAVLVDCQTADAMIYSRIAILFNETFRSPNTETSVEGILN